MVATLDVRGRHASEGKFLKVQPADATDGYDVIEWLAGQPWSNGSVGMWGTSFAAHTQAGAAQYSPPSLKTLVINMGGLSNGWVQLALATPVVLWGGWPFFVRAWQSLATRNLNMFTLIGMGVLPPSGTP